MLSGHSNTNNDDNNSPTTTTTLLLIIILYIQSFKKKSGSWPTILKLFAIGKLVG